MFDRFSREDRTIMMFAMQEARDLGHPGIGNDHLILGMLCNARSPLFGLLGEQGLTLDTAREVVRAHHEAEPDIDADAAAEAAADRRYEEDREALRSIGIDLDRVREAVRAGFGDDVAEGWGDRERGRRRGRGPRGEECGERRRGHGHGHGPHGHGRSRRGRGPWGGPGFGDGPDADRFGEDGPWEGGRGRRGPRGRGRARMNRSVRAALHEAVDFARGRGDERLTPEHVLLGILEVGDPASRAVIESVTDVDTLRAAVAATLPDSAAV